MTKLLTRLRRIRRKYFGFFSFDVPKKFFTRAFWAGIKRKVLREPSWLIRDVAVALAVAIVVSQATITAQEGIDDRRSQREQDAATLLADQSAEAGRRQATLAIQLQNQSFVRERSGPEFVDRPFQGLDLEDMELAGLTLNGANFQEASLRSTNFRQTLLRGADFSEAHVDSSTSFKWAFLDGVTMAGIRGELHLVDAYAPSAWLVKVTFARLSNVDLSFAILNGADLRAAEMKDVRLEGACYDSETKWPADFTPPPSGKQSVCSDKYLEVNLKTPKHNLWGLEPLG
ncbi:pentapeptide repeat-containing protein [Pseudarthrobacter enclensis]|uniref:pentapeptide repeat-containing protein n=1 Tax=Pseudarthrobacter enclensis TaxID=993070 RepID=UPI003EDF1983